MYEYEHSDHHQNGGDPYLDPQAQGHHQGRGHQGSGGGGQQNAHYYGQGHQRYDDEDENSDMW